MSRTILIGILLLLTSTAFATDRLVPSQYLTIQQAIDAAGTGDTVIVADEVYTGRGNRDIDFKGKTITVRSENGPESCTIDCQALGRGFYFHSGEDKSSVLDGFTISNGYASYGAGIWCSSSPTITNCTLTGNTASNQGGGIYCKGRPTLSNCAITGNTAEDGGGIYCHRSQPTITHCTITGNTGENGGGLYLYRVSPGTITTCAIASNQAVFGGGIYCYGSNPTVRNCTISGNSASNDGGGIFCETNSSLTLTNTILWLNEDSGGVVELAQLYVGKLDVIYSCIQDDDPNDAYIPFGGESNGNIDDDPMFVRDPNDGGDGWGVGDNDDFGDLHLQSSSPCINAGDPDFVTGNETDVDGQPRVIGLRVDMGADELFIPMIIVTRPQGGEVWVSGSIHAITWYTYIYEETVNILFSKDGGSNWQTIENSVSDTSSYVWYLPDIVDSNKCLISVVPSVNDSDVLCIGSGLFTIHPDSPDPVVGSRWKSLGGGFKPVSYTHLTLPTKA